MSDTHHRAPERNLVAERRPQRVRHELRFRLLEVQRVERLTPHMVRITLGGDELEGFSSPGFDDHIKVFFPASGEDGLQRAEEGDRRMPFSDGQPRPVTRDFTPRHYDPVMGVLEIDFALHDTGPATEWATLASPGQKLAIGGPRGSFLVPMDFDWHLLIGDDTALPAVARRLAELPAGARVLVIAEVDGKADELSFETRAAATVHWVHRSAAATGTDPLVEALKTVSLPKGDYHAWIGCESLSAKRLRQTLIAEHGGNPKWIRASGYWRRGAAGAHDSFDE